MEALTILLAIVVGTLLSSLLACLPALHIFNVAGILILGVLKLQQMGLQVPPVPLICFMMSLVVGYAILNTIPSIFLGAPDEAAVFVTMPGNRYLMLGKGFEASVLTGLGGLGGIIFLVLFAPLAPFLLPGLQRLLSRNLFWILGAILGFMVMSEWPKGGDRGKSSWQRFRTAWKNLIAGLLTLLLAGLFGFVISYRSVIPIESAFQNIMPAFVGLFAIPWVISNIISKTNPPAQHIATSLDVTPQMLCRGVGAGSGGGLFAAIVPIVTGGIGGLLAGHATAQRDDRLFIISQGASKVVYYVGGFFLFFVPGVRMTRGGMSWMVSGLYTPLGYADYYLIICTICIAGALSFVMLLFFSRAVIWLIQKVDYRLLSWLTLLFISSVVIYITSWPGLLVMCVGTGIGMIPVFFHARRSNCMGVLLIPVMLDMAGVGPTVASWLGLT